MRPSSRSARARRSRTPRRSRHAERAAENRIGITVRFPESVHERLRVLAFERRTSKQALIEGWVAEQLGGEVKR